MPRKAGTLESDSFQLASASKRRKAKGSRSGRLEQTRSGVPSRRLDQLLEDLGIDDVLNDTEHIMSTGGDNRTPAQPSTSPEGSSTQRTSRVSFATLPSEGGLRRTGSAVRLGLGEGRFSGRVKALAGAGSLSPAGSLNASVHRLPRAGRGGGTSSPARSMRSPLHGGPPQAAEEAAAAADAQDDGGGAGAVHTDRSQQPRPVAHMVPADSEQDAAIREQDAGYVVSVEAGAARPTADSCPDRTDAGVRIAADNGSAEQPTPSNAVQAHASPSIAPPCETSPEGACAVQTDEPLQSRPAAVAYNANSGQPPAIRDTEAGQVDSSGAIVAPSAACGRSDSIGAGERIAAGDRPAEQPTTSNAAHAHASPSTALPCGTSRGATASHTGVDEAGSGVSDGGSTTARPQQRNVKPGPAPAAVAEAVDTNRTPSGELSALEALQEPDAVQHRVSLDYSAETQRSGSAASPQMDVNTRTSGGSADDGLAQHLQHASSGGPHSARAGVRPPAHAFESAEASQQPSLRLDRTSDDRVELPGGASHSGATPVCEPDPPVPDSATAADQGMEGSGAASARCESAVEGAAAPETVDTGSGCLQNDAACPSAQQPSSTRNEPATAEHDAGSSAGAATSTCKPIAQVSAERLRDDERRLLESFAALRLEQQRQAQALERMERGCAYKWAFPGVSRRCKVPTVLRDIARLQLDCGACEG